MDGHQPEFIIPKVISGKAMKKQVFEKQIEVRFRDIDAMGHVNNAVYFTYFEEGRKAFFHQVLNSSDPLDFPFILAHIDCDFIQPVQLGDDVTLQMWIGTIGSKSFTIQYQLTNGSTVYAKGKSVQVCFDYKENRSIPVSPEFSQMLGAYRCE